LFIFRVLVRFWSADSIIGVPLSNVDIFLYFSRSRVHVKSGRARSHGPNLGALSGPDIRVSRP